VKASSRSPSGTGRGRWCAGMNLVQHNHLRAGIAGIPDRLDDQHEHIQHLRDQDGERYATRRIVCTAGAAAWPTHAKRRDTGNPDRQRYPHRDVIQRWAERECWFGVSVAQHFSPKVFPEPGPPLHKSWCRSLKHPTHARCHTTQRRASS
jgi:hypothetical protein